MEFETSSVEHMTVTKRRKASITSKITITFKENVQKKMKGKKDYFMDYDKIEDEEPPPLRYIPERLEVLSEESGLEKGQLRTLYRGFKEACPNGAINEVTFRHIYCQLFPLGADGNAYAHYIFKALDKRQTGSLTFSELVRGLASLVNGSLQERLRWIFRLYDIDHDGEISRDEMSAVIGAIHDLIGPCDVQSEKHTDFAFQKLDLNSDGVITIDEFMACCFNVSRMKLCASLLKHLAVGKKAPDVEQESRYQKA